MSRGGGVEEDRRTFAAGSGGPHGHRRGHGRAPDGVRNACARRFHARRQRPAASQAIQPAQQRQGEPGMTSAARIEDIAATWLVRRESPEWSARDQAEFDAWLAESTLHEVAYLRLEYGWRSVDRLAVLKSPPAPQPSSDAPVD